VPGDPSSPWGAGWDATTDKENQAGALAARHLWPRIQRQSSETSMRTMAPRCPAMH